VVDRGLDAMKAALAEPSNAAGLNDLASRSLSSLALDGAVDAALAPYRWALPPL